MPKPQDIEKKKTEEKRILEKINELYGRKDGSLIKHLNTHPSYINILIKRADRNHLIDVILYDISNIPKTKEFHINKEYLEKAKERMDCSEKSTLAVTLLSEIQKACEIYYGSISKFFFPDDKKQWSKILQKDKEGYTETTSQLEHNAKYFNI